MDDTPIVLAPFPLDFLQYFSRVRFTLQAIQGICSFIGMAIVGINETQGGIVLLSLQKQKQLGLLSIHILWVQAQYFERKFGFRMLLNDWMNYALLSHVFTAFPKWPPSIWAQRDVKRRFRRSGTGNGCLGMALISFHFDLWDIVVGFVDFGWGIVVGITEQLTQRGFVSVLTYSHGLWRSSPFTTTNIMSSEEYVATSRMPGFF